MLLCWYPAGAFLEPSLQYIDSCLQREQLGADGDPRDAYEIVTEAMQAELSLMAADRTLPVVG